jgi:hypothetical protein
MLKAAFRYVLFAALLPAASVAADACSLVTTDRTVAPAIRDSLLPGVLAVSAGSAGPAGTNTVGPCILRIVPGTPELMQSGPLAKSAGLISPSAMISPELQLYDGLVGPMRGGRPGAMRLTEMSGMRLHWRYSPPGSF